MTVSGAAPFVANTSAWRRAPAQASSARCSSEPPHAVTATRIRPADALIAAAAAEHAVPPEPTPARRRPGEPEAGSWVWRPPGQPGTVMGQLGMAMSPMTPRT